MSKIGLQSRVASCHLINLLLLKQLTYPMWCFMVLFAFLRTLSAPKVCAQHHYSVQISLPSAHTSEHRPNRVTAYAEWFGAHTDSLRLFDSTVIRDA